jgi:hypothetical protein
MITYEHVPFIRQTAKKLLADGKIDHKRYIEIISFLDDIESDKIKFDENSMNAAKKNIINQRSFAFI